MTAKEVLHKIPYAFKPEAAGDTNAVIQYAISDPVYHVIKDGNMEVHDGQADNPDVTVIISDDDLVRLMKGELNGMNAFMTGKLKVKGDMMLAQRLVSMVDQRKLSQA